LTYINQLCGFGLKWPISHIRKVKTIRSKRHKYLIELVVAARKKAGFRQVQLAKKLKRSQTWIARLESGERRLDVVELIDLAEVIGFDAPAMVAAVQQHQGKK
jgi:ribosome-binding protein aMBF1 (putative translation factor)